MARELLGIFGGANKVNHRYSLPGNLFKLSEAVAGVELPVIVGSQSLYAVTSNVPDSVRRSAKCGFLLLAVGPLLWSCC